MNDNSEAESVVQINELQLDKECIRLPSDYLKYASAAADSKRDVSQAKAELDVIEADLSRSIREHPAKYGLEKETQAAVAAAVILQPEYARALKLLHKAQHQSALADAVVWALEHKKRSLTLLVDLHGMGYFAAPKITPKGKEAVEQMTKQRTRRAWSNEE